MGVGATTADITKMVNNTSDQCAFACHDLSDPNNYYNLAKSLGVTTRIDVLRTATQQLMDTAKTTAAFSNQFRMAIYTFGASARRPGLTKIQSLTKNLIEGKDVGCRHRPDDGALPELRRRYGHQPRRCPGQDERTRSQSPATARRRQSR